MTDVPASLVRFTNAERWVHRGTGLLMGTCLVTAFVLYYGPVSLAVGHRHTVELIHVWAGYALGAPLLLGLLSSAYRADLRVLNRFSREDWRWLRSKNRRDGSFEVGKFNAGQKLNAALTAGSIIVLLGTGTLMFWTGLVRLAWRTGATFVHDWFALGLGLHRLEAGTMVENVASQRVLEACGYEQYGLAPKLLFLNGAWRDHVLFQKLLHDRPL